MPRVPPVTSATFAMMASSSCTDQLRGGEPISIFNQAYDETAEHDIAPRRRSTLRAARATCPRPKADGPADIARLSALDAHGDPHAAPDTQGREALLGIALLHLM